MAVTETLKELTDPARLEALKLRPEHGPNVSYSCYFGAYEPFHPYATLPSETCDRVIFTDRDDLPAPGCRVVNLAKHFPDWEPKALSRLPKLCPEVFFPDHDWTFYVDNRARMKFSLEEIVAGLTAERGEMGLDMPAGRYLFKHAERRCAWREAKVCRKMGFMSDAEYEKVKGIFTEAQFPVDQGLYVNTALLQRMGSAEAAHLNLKWMEMFRHDISRDQVILPFVLWREGASCQVVERPLVEILIWPLFGKKVREKFRQNQPIPSRVMWRLLGPGLLKTEAEVPAAESDASGAADALASGQGEELTGN